ncbi:MAG: hypothetical protein AB7F43_08705 [Bacteriovoracia bacterium]
MARAYFSFSLGNQTFFHTDGSTESFTIFAANKYLDDGFFKNYLLPTYPPFGKDPQGNNRSEPFVYTHYLAGQDLVLGVWMKIFGRDSIASARLIPLTLTTIGLGWLGLEFAIWVGSAAMACLFLSLFMIPRSLTIWSICIYGHSYVMAFYLMLLAGMLRLVNRSQKKLQVNFKTSPTAYAWLLGLGVGWMQMQFDLDWVPLTFIAAMSFAVLVPLNAALAKRVLAGIFLGATAAFVYQVILGALYMGSLKEEALNLWQWLFWRSGATGADEYISLDDLKIHKILHEFNRQTYGATGWTAINLVALGLSFGILGVVAKIRDMKWFKRTFVAMFLAYLASAIWNIFMRQHSLAHVRFISRHYFVLYPTVVFIILPISLELIRAAWANVSLSPSNSEHPSRGA